MGVSIFIEKLLMARTDGSYLKLRDKFIKADFLIIDDELALDTIVDKL